MKKIIVLVTLIASLYGSVLEVKSADGKNYYTSNEKPKLFVCYEKRLIYVSDDTQMIKYIGCKQYKDSCKANHKVRFGKYPNNKKAKEALVRCKKSKPKFID